MYMFCGELEGGGGGGCRERKSGRECGQAELFSSFFGCLRCRWVSKRAKQRVLKMNVMIFKSAELRLIDLFLFHYFLLSIRLYVLSCHVDVMIHSHTDQWMVASRCCSSCHPLFFHRVISYVLLYIPVAKTFCSTRNPLWLLILLGRKKEKKTQTN